MLFERPPDLLAEVAVAGVREPCEFCGQLGLNAGADHHQPVRFVNAVNGVHGLLFGYVREQNA
jgi:hypothetical protein